MNHSLTVITDQYPLPLSGHRLHLQGKEELNLYPDLFTLECWNLSQGAFLHLSRSRMLSILYGKSCIAFGEVSDVYRRTVPEGEVTEVAFAKGLSLWESPVSLSVPAGLSASEIVSVLIHIHDSDVTHASDVIHNYDSELTHDLDSQLTHSYDSILTQNRSVTLSLLGWNGDDPIFTRGQAFHDRTALCLTSVLSSAGAKGTLIPVGTAPGSRFAASDASRSAFTIPGGYGLCVIPSGGLPVSVHLSARDLLDAPSFTSNNLMVISTRPIGWQVGATLALEYKDSIRVGTIIERNLDLDTMTGSWKTELLVELRNR